MESNEKKRIVGAANISLLIVLLAVVIIALNSSIPPSIYTTTSKAATIPYAFFSIIIPILIFLSGGIVLFFAIKAIIKIRNSKHENDESGIKLVGTGRAVSAIIIGFLLLLIALGQIAGVKFEIDRINRIASQYIDEVEMAKDNYFGFDYFNSVHDLKANLLGVLKFFIMKMMIMMELA